jgi:hypothetical protein
MPPSPRDRRDLLSRQTTWNGIDFVEVANATQTVLKVHFLNQAPELSGHVSAAVIDGGEAIPSVAVAPIAAADWSHDSHGRPLLTLHTAAPGDFSTYRLSLVSDRLDPYFRSVAFSFKAGCVSDLDCEPSGPACPPDVPDLPVIDYLAKDFRSFRQALLAFSSLYYPDWQERNEADFGVMFAEALSACADDLSYLQDRFAAEAFLETASERRSLVRLARLVDYEPRPATAARALLRWQVAPGVTAIPSGLRVSGFTHEGVAIDFETGTGLRDRTSYAVSNLWDPLQPYWWDDADRCLLRGATSTWVIGSGLGLKQGMAILIDTAAPFPADPPSRVVVHLSTDPIEETDALVGVTVTRLDWRADEALATDRDLTRTVLSANLVPSTQGRRVRDMFAVGSRPAGDRHMRLAIVRGGPNGTPRHLHTLDADPLAWLAPDASAPGATPSIDTQAPQPEILLERTDQDPAQAWTFRRSLLSSNPFEESFTLDPMRFATLDARSGAGPDAAAFTEYDGSAGTTIRFGDGLFGEIPEDGAIFTATYRIGGGRAGNLAADTLVNIDPLSPLSSARVSNPFAAEGGSDAEPDATVRDLAPQAFQAVQFRAVIPADYAAAAETLPWVQRAGASFRWTGSWLTVFTTADPLGSEALPVRRRTELWRLLDRYRQAGYEVYTPPPSYVSLDLIVTVCARAGAFQGDVEAGVLAALDNTRHLDGKLGFFHPDNFTFGTPLEKSRLEAAIQEVPGVDGVVDITYRRRGFTVGFIELVDDQIAIGSAQIIRVDNDPSKPEHGSLRVEVEGGK